MRFNKKSSTKALVVVGVVFTVYQIVKPKDDFVIQNAKQVVHPTGLVVRVPQNYIAKKSDAGFVIEPKNNDLRIPISIDVSVSARGLGDSFFEERIIAGRTINYLLTKNGGGSGGENYDLMAYEFVDERFIIYTQNTQEELGEPDFELFWKIVANARFKQKP